MISLEKELAINQFGQGVDSDPTLLDQFIQLDKDQQQERFFDLYFHTWKLELVHADVEQALADCSLKATDATYSFLNLHRVKTGLKYLIDMPDTENPPEGTLEEPYKLVLYLFKAAYQRRFKLEKENPANWRYWDLSRPEIVKSILTRHKELIEEVYNTPSFRSEFVCIAKLWHDSRLLQQTKEPEPAQESLNQFNFLTYDELVANSIKLYTDKYCRGISVLLHSVGKALAAKYGLDKEQTIRLEMAIIERHLRETYNTGLF